MYPHTQTFLNGYIILFKTIIIVAHRSTLKQRGKFLLESTPLRN